MDWTAAAGVAGWFFAIGVFVGSWATRRDVDIRRGQVLTEHFDWSTAQIRSHRVFAGTPAVGKALIHWRGRLWSVTIEETEA